MAEAFMLWGSPNVCPTSWDDTNRTSSPMTSSSNSTARAWGFAAAVYTKYQFLTRFMTLWYHWMSLSRISPERGSWMWGPEAF